MTPGIPSQLFAWHLIGRYQSNVDRNLGNIDKLTNFHFSILWGLEKINNNTRVPRREPSEMHSQMPTSLLSHSLRRSLSENPNTSSGFHIYYVHLFCIYMYILHTVFMYKIIYARLYRRRNRNDAWIVKYVHTSSFVCSQLIQFLNCMMYSKRIKYSKH